MPKYRNTAFRIGLCLTVFTGVPALAGAQSGQVVDQGSFTITVSGQRTGRESFRILGTPRARPQSYSATATVVYGDRRLAPIELRADSSGTATSYMVQVHSAGPEQETWKGTIVRGRVSATIQSPRGESAKEFVVTDGAVILDDDVYHQYYFVTRFLENGSVPVVIPRRNSQITLRITPKGTDRITINTRDIEARHYALTENSGAQRDLWVDSEGRVLKVAIPGRGIVVVRDDPPQ